jgi:segregation and condensation protein B
LDHFDSGPGVQAKLVQALDVVGLANDVGNVRDFASRQHFEREEVVHGSSGKKAVSIVRLSINYRALSLDCEGRRCLRTIDPRITELMAKKARKSSPQSSKGKPTPPASGTAPSRARARVVRIEETSEEPSPGIDDSGVSLEDLSAAFSALIDRGPTPYAPAPMESPADQPPISAADRDLIGVAAEPEVDGSADDACPISPKTILETMLFVGHPGNEPLATETASNLMRGVTAEEVHELIEELNAEYEQQRRPYRIVSEGSGYRMALLEEFSQVVAKLNGRVREAKLSQSAIDILSIVAYQQPITAKGVDEMRGRGSASILNQLVRRNLLKIERVADHPGEVRYVTSKRFLDLFGLDSIEDLPKGVDLER